MKNNTTPPKPTIREQIEQILNEPLVRSKYGKCPHCSFKTKSYITDKGRSIAEHIRTNHPEVPNKVDKLLALLSPQTGEGECICSEGENGQPSGHSTCGFPCPVHSISEEMEKDFLEGQEFYELMQVYRHTPIQEVKVVANAFEAVKAFLRKQLDLQEKRFREMIGGYEGAILDPDEEKRISARNNFRAELRSKLSVQKGEK